MSKSDENKITCRAGGPHYPPLIRDTAGPADIADVPAIPQDDARESYRLDYSAVVAVYAREVVMDWSGHRDVSPGPCGHCRQSTSTTNCDGRRAHKSCAERAATAAL